MCYSPGNSCSSNRWLGNGDTYIPVHRGPVPWTSICLLCLRGLPSNCRFLFYPTRFAPFPWFFSSLNLSIQIFLIRLSLQNFRPSSGYAGKFWSYKMYGSTHTASSYSIDEFWGSLWSLWRGSKITRRTEWRSLNEKKDQEGDTFTTLVMLSGAKHLAEPWSGWAQILRCSNDDTIRVWATSKGSNHKKMFNPKIFLFRPGAKSQRNIRAYSNCVFLGLLGSQTSHWHMRRRAV